MTLGLVYAKHGFREIFVAQVWFLLPYSLHPAQHAPTKVSWEGRWLNLTLTRSLAFQL